MAHFFNHFTSMAHLKKNHFTYPIDGLRLSTSRLPAKISSASWQRVSLVTT